MFSRSLITEQVGHESWRVVKGFSFTSVTGLVVTVPKNFTCDLASIPAFAQFIISKVGYWSQPAVVHDLLYRNHRNGLDDTITRLQADNILLEGCRIKAVDFSVSDSERRDWLIYGGVRVGGRDSWLTDSERSVVRELPAYYDQ